MDTDSGQHDAPHDPPRHLSAVPAATPDGEPVPADSVQEAVKLPVYGVRADSPGPRGCWALRSRDLQPCAAAKAADSDYCTAHSGRGVAADPAAWSRKGAAVAAENRRRRATLRLALGQVRMNTPRGVLRAAVFAEAERVAAAALDGALDPALSSASRSQAALRLIDAVDPPLRAELTMPLPTDPDGVSALSLSQLDALALQVGISDSA